MKKYFLTTTTFIAIMLFGFGLKAQNPTYTLSIANAKIISATEYQFDVVMQRTGAAELKLALFQLGILMNPEIIPAGAKIKVSAVEGSSELLKDQQPAAERFSFDSVKKCIIVTPFRTPGGGISATVIPANKGLKICVIKVSSTLPFNKSISTNHTWNFNFANGYATKIFAWVKGETKELNTDITVKNSHLKSNTTPPDVVFGK